MRWVTGLLSVMGALLMSSLAANFVLFDRVDQYYREANSTRLDPGGLNYYPIEPQPPKDSNSPKDFSDRRVIIFGDSRAEGWTIPEVEGYEFINRGVGSQTSVQVLQRFSSHVAPLEPDIIVVQVGINDLKTIGLFPNRAESIVNDLQTNLAEIVARGQATGALVIVSTILPAGRVPLIRRFVWSNEIDLAVVEVNDYIKSQKDEWGVMIFDGYSIIAADDGRMNPEFRKDELHITPAGYEALNQQFVPVVRSLPHSTDTLP